MRGKEGRGCGEFKDIRELKEIGKERDVNGKSVESKLGGVLSRREKGCVNE